MSLIKYINKTHVFCLHLIKINHLVDYLNLQQKPYLHKTFDFEFPYIKVRFTDKSSKAPQIEDRIKLTLVLN